MNRGIGLLVLAAMGAGWGLTQPLTKIAVSEGYRHFGLIFWQFAIGIAVLAPVQILRGKALPLGLPQIRVYAIIALIGTILPNAAGYEAARHLPAGILSILISTVPMFSFAMALALGTDRFSWLRLAGLAMGLVGVILLVGPDALPNSAAAVFVPLALSASVFYAAEGNIVARWGTQGADAIQVLFGASVFGLVLSVPLALATGSWITPQFPLEQPDFALIVSSVAHTTVYCTYVWMLGRTGAVFTSQVGYLVTGFGIIWAMLILNESYSGPFWVALALVMAGVALVQPRSAAQ